MATASSHFAERELRLREALVGRVINLRSMPRTLRLLTALAVAQLVATSAIAIARNVNQPFVVVAVQADHAEIGVPVVLFVATVVFLCLAWAYLLTGVLHARWQIRLAGLVVLTLGMIGILTDGYQQPLIGIAILAGLWVLGLAVTLLDRLRPLAQATDHRPASHLRSYTFVVALILTSAFYTLAWVSNGSNNDFGGAIYLQFTQLTFFLVPLLYLAGSDFAEWGELTGARLSGIARRRGRWLGLVLCLLLAMAIVAYVVIRFGWSFAGTQLVLGGVCAALLVGLVWLARVGRDGHVHVPVRALIIVAAIALLWIQGGDAILRNLHSNTDFHNSPLGTLVVFTHEEDPVFSIQVPPKWDKSDWDFDDGSRDIRFTEGKPDSSPQFNVVAGPASTAAGGDDLPSAVASLGYDKVMPSKRDDTGGWRNWDFTAVNSNGDQVKGEVFQRAEADRVWTIVGDSPPDKADETLGVYDDMVTTWKPSLPEQSQTTSLVRNVTDNYDWVPWVVIVMGVVVALAVRRRLPTLGVAGIVLLFVGVSGVQYLMNSIPKGLTATIGHGQGAGEGFRLGLTIEGILLTVAVASIVVAIWAALRRTEGTSFAVLAMLSANVGLAILVVVLNLYDAATSAEGRFSLAQGAIILLAILWDLIMSGSSVTNGDGHWFPRHARVLMYCGYILLVASAILFYASQHVIATGVAAEPDFESDSWPALGVSALGVPLLVTIMLVSLSGLLRRRPAAEPLTPD